ncbi:uncharacterized protein [Neodiprion pinetum]|uniref:uncharacterized protein n=1 Tax=Neodiprion pinetum TaxID=441929 RepID=UPI00372279BA
MRIALRRFRVPSSLPPGSCPSGPLPGKTRLSGQEFRNFFAPGPPPSGTRLLGKALRSFCAQGPLPAGTRLPGQRLRGSCAPVRYLVKLDFQNMRSVDLAVQYSRYDPGWLAVAAGDRGRRGGGGRGRRGKQSGRRGRGFVLGITRGD